MEELIMAAPGRIAMSAPEALSDDVMAISYVAEMPEAAADDLRTKAYERQQSIQQMSLGEISFLR